MDYLDKIKEEQNDVCHSALVCIKPFLLKSFIVNKQRFT